MTAKKKPVLEAKVLNIYQRITAVMGDVTRVGKGANVGGKYLGVRHDDVAAMLRPLMVRHGIVMVISEDAETTVCDTGVMYGKRKLFQLRGRFWVRFINTDNPDDFSCFYVSAWADDEGDKGPGKLISYAAKTALLKQFMVESGDEEENRVDDDKLTFPKVTQEQALRLLAEAESLWGSDHGAGKLRAMMQKIYFEKAGDVAKLRADLFDNAIKTLNEQFEREEKRAANVKTRKAKLEPKAAP